MAKYHITEAGEPGLCRAKPNNCPFGADEAHFTTKEGAWKALDSGAVKIRPALNTIKKPSLLERKKKDLTDARAYFDKVSKIHKKKMKEFTDAEKSIKDNLLAGTTSDPKVLEVYRQSEIEIKVLTAERNNAFLAYQKAQSAVQDQLQKEKSVKDRLAVAAREAADKKKKPADYIPYPPYYGSCGGSGGGC